MATHIQNTTREVTFPVTGMTCASCVRRIERALAKVEGVSEAAVNLATEQAKIRYDPKKTGVEQLAAAIQKAGYGVRELPPSPTLPAAAVPSAPQELTIPV